MICQSHMIILGWAVRICCADLHQYHANFRGALDSDSKTQGGG